MKKKLLTLAMAATMAVSTVISASAATADTFEGAVFAENTGDETLKGDFDITYTFKNEHTDANAGNNWENFLIEFYSDAVEVGTTGKGFLTVRGDAYGWWAEGWGADGGQTPVDFNTTWTLPEGHDWAVWNPDMDGAEVTINAKRTGEKISLEYVMVGASGTEYKFTNEIENVYGFGETIYVHLTAENTKLSNIKFVDNKAVAEDNKTDDKNDTAATTTKAAEGEDEGGLNPVVIVVVVVVAVVVVAGIVMATKKKN